MKRKATSRKNKTGPLSDLFLGEYPTHSRFAESYRSLRTNIHFSFLEKDFRSLLITSAGAGEGKSISTANLSYTMAQAGKTVLMVDADLRKPTLNRLLQTHHAPGISGLLSDTFSIDIRSGALTTFGVSDLMRLLSFQKKTGFLDLTEAGEHIRMYFLRGDLKDVQWMTRPDEKKMAALLVKDKVLTREQAEQARARAKNTGQKLGFILVNMGLVKADELTSFIALHMMEGLRIALQFKSGTFAFTQLPETHFEQSTFNPTDFPQLYRQALIGPEAFVYLQNAIDNAIITTAVENLYLLPSGPPPPKPAELLGSERMSFLLSYLSRRFDVMVIDTPPVLLTSDALLIAPQTDCVLLVVKTGQIKREGVKKTVDQIQRAHANLIGVALNAVDDKKEGYYQYYSTYYEEN